MSQEQDPAALLSPLRTEDEGRAWLLAMVDDVEAIRRQIDVAVMVREQRRLYARWMIYQGRALGALTALKRAELLSDEGYNQMRERIVTTRRPTVIPSGPLAPSDANL